MKFGYFSDTHFEFQNRNVSKTLEFLTVDGLDAVLLAGDISTLDPTARDRFIVNTPDVIRQCSARFKCPVLAVNGNHEFYGLDMRDFNPHASYEVGNSMYGSGYTKQIGNFLIIVCTLWTDYCLMGEDWQQDAMRECSLLSDSRRIKIEGRPFTSEEALKLHNEDVSFIRRNLKIAKSYGLRPIILTHHVPHSVARNPKFPVDLISAGFYSDLTELLEEAAYADCAGWIFGHHHWCIEDRASLSFPLLSAQMGYVGEDSNWNGIGVLEV